MVIAWITSILIVRWNYLERCKDPGTEFHGEPLVSFFAALIAGVVGVIAFVKKSRVKPAADMSVAQHMDPSEKDLGWLRRSVSICFVDDQEFEVVEQLRERGYSVFQIREVFSRDEIAQIDADVVFCDVSGVATTIWRDLEGAGVVRDLKEVRYPPFVVAYTSSTPVFASEASRILHKVADAQLDKQTAEVVTFEEKIDRELLQLFGASRFDLAQSCAAKAAGVRNLSPGFELVEMKRVFLDPKAPIDDGSKARMLRLIRNRLLAAV